MRNRALGGESDLWFGVRRIRRAVDLTARLAFAHARIGARGKRLALRAAQLGINLRNILTVT